MLTTKHGTATVCARLSGTRYEQVLEDFISKISETRPHQAGHQESYERTESVEDEERSGSSSLIPEMYRTQSCKEGVWYSTV
ncbi:hypothetical protein AVEN_43047-1 [Araneus ventricosus]|uniref:Uncharacterized protein n=1 Tax=Araneus ventricosus TaxID=182803 RepID=A0A4Y2H6E4_ARAVE|nr:hypothetical protein AVEN_43047-1 [Araneus ventricosus]